MDVLVGRFSRRHFAPAPAAPERRRSCVVALALAILVSCAAAQSPDEALWAQIEALRLPPASMPATARFDAAHDRLEQLVQKARLYRSLYPGGARRNAAVAAELSALYDIGCLDKGDFTALKKAASAHAQDTTSEETRAEGAFWLMLCDHLGSTSSAPTSAPVFDESLPLLGAYRRYVEQFPRSRHSPRLAEMVIEDALNRGALDEARSALTALQNGHPQHQTTERLTGAIRRVESIGQPFQATFRLTDGSQLSTQSLAGQPLLILLWTPDEARSAAFARGVERFVREHPTVQVIAAPLTRSQDEKYPPGWRIADEPLSLGGEFARSWGVSRSPTIFVIDAQGRLLGTSSVDGWERLLSEKGSAGP